MIADHAYQVLMVALLIFGFGFVVFFHELGHFLAAKWAGVKVEQFAVGFGQALLSWRKGLGFRWGSSGKEYEALLKDEKEGIQRTDVHAIGETEYRLNWIPLGGYVKMLGQDDLKPAFVDDPRAYNNKSIGKRMVIVSAGVIMNIILAAIGFMALFLIGFKAPASIVGVVYPNSPGEKAGIRPGDRILYLDDKYMHDWTKVQLTTALAKEGAPVPVYVERLVDGKPQGLQLSVTPQAEEESKGFLALGIGAAPELRGLDKQDAVADDPKDKELFDADVLAIQPGDVVVAINGRPVGRDVVENPAPGARVEQPAWKYAFPQLNAAVQQSQGKPVQLTLKGADGKERTVDVHPKFQKPFGNEPVNFAGMLPRAAVDHVFAESKARGKLLPGDAVVSLVIKGDPVDAPPSEEELRKWLSKAGQEKAPVDVTVLRGDKEMTFTGITPDVRFDRDHYGLGIGLVPDGQHPVVADVMKNSPAEKAGLKRGDVVATIAGKPVENWFQVYSILRDATPGQAIAVTTKAGKSAEITLTKEQVAAFSPNPYTVTLPLHELVEVRKTSNPVVAAGWGIVETRDFILQFYLTLQRMAQGSVSHKNLMGPVGIVTAGAKFAFKGADWLIWFLAMISANLAVVNFLPIPIVDGGLFTFLILEKIQGKPLSPRAQAIAQVVGLALILGVFLLVTYQDVMRLFQISG
jgi:regulator of sigma E protease